MLGTPLHAKLVYIGNYCLCFVAKNSVIRPIVLFITHVLFSVKMQIFFPLLLLLFKKEIDCQLYRFVVLNALDGSLGRKSFKVHN